MYEGPVPTHPSLRSRCMLCIYLSGAEPLHNMFIIIKKEIKTINSLHFGLILLNGF